MTDPSPNPGSDTVARLPVVFVCVENSNRSQMAEAFARRHGADVLEPFSAGSRPSGVVNPKAIAAMAELGIDIAGNGSKGLADLPERRWAWIVTMGCGDSCPWLPATHREDWALADPKHMEPAQFNEVRDDIERRVLDLIRQAKETVR